MRKGVPVLTVTFCTLTATGLVLQLIYPQLPQLFERNAAEVLSGEWWRLVTALFFQDGGLVGGVANIAALVFVGGWAEQILAPLEWVGVYWIGALGAGLVGLAWQPIGAGNSIAICSLAGALVVGWPAAERNRWLLVGWRVFAAVGAAILLARRDIHGFAFVAGVVVYVIFRSGFRRPQSPGG
jgi:hypothetical protein